MTDQRSSSRTGHRFVVFDLETISDRARPEDHEIIEIGACKVEDGIVVERWSSLVCPTRSLPAATTALTGITEELLAGAPELTQVLRDFVTFVARQPLVAHNGHGYDFVVLDAACARLGVPPPVGERLDTLELAHLAFSRAGARATPNVDGLQPPPGRQLAQLSTALGVEATGTLHRALDDAELTVAVIAGLRQRLDADTAVRRHQRWVLETTGHPWSAYLVPGARQPLEEVVPEPPLRTPTMATGRFDPAAAAASLDVGGSLLTGGREHRPQQVEMARAVADTLAAGGQLMVEAPTGTGKTLGYLTPAVAYAKAAGRPVVIATHSKLLQNQAIEAIPQLQMALGEPIEAVVLKGRDNYVSLQALEGELDGLVSDSASAGFLLALICGWLSETPTGEWDDLRFWPVSDRHPGFPALRWRLSIDEQPGAPRSELDQRCFYRRALDGVRTADIAVMNHALIVSRDDWLLVAQDLILDEAHNLEESATTALSEELTQVGLARLVDSIFDPERRWGMIGRLRDATTNGQPEETAAVLEALTTVRRESERFGDELIAYVRDRSGARHEVVDRFGASYRIRHGSDTHRLEYRAVERSGRRLAASLRELGGALNRIVVPAVVEAPYHRERLEAELRRVARAVWDAPDLLFEVMLAGGGGDDWIYIADLSRTGGAWQWGLRRAPLSVAGALRDLWDTLDSVVLTSATLRVAGEWGHLVGRLGLNAVRTLPLLDVFPRLSQQHLMVLPDHLPTPRGGLLAEFVPAEADELARLFLLTGGGGLALLTARSRLEFIRDHVRPLLDAEGLPLLAQGDAPAPALQERMLEERETSLLALRSFWEGVDLPGEALRLLAIEKLPFDPPNDPIAAARMEDLELRGRDPFSEYLVPQAVLRFTQGVGRLIRSSEDVGATVVLDRRLRKPVPYREQFLRSLPGPPRMLRPLTAEEGYQAIAEHLGIALDADLLTRLAALPSADPWAALDELQMTEAEALDPAIAEARLTAVRNLLGFTSWRPGQLEVMLRFIRGEDVLAVLPTGSGKSLTFQLPALLLPGLTLVVSPLIALMRDQVERLRGRELGRVGAIYSGIPQSEQEELLAGARAGRYKLLYVSPERLWSKRFREALAGVQVARLVVDEAHCISQWGHSFRPEYSSIPEALRDVAGVRQVPVAALTATASERVREEIQALLELRGDSVVGLPDRPELRYFVERCEDFADRDVRIVEVLDAFRGQPTIVYVPRRADATRIASLLRASNHVARAYHGGMEGSERISVEEAFRYNEIDVVVATKAFGLGIDKPDVAAVVHLEMPASIEEYVQETGRCARGATSGDGPSVGYCVLLSTPRDCGIHRQFVRGAAPDIEVVRAVWDAVRTGSGLCPPEQLAAQAGLDEHEAEAVALAVHYLQEDGCLVRHEDLMWEGRVWLPTDVDRLIADLEAADASLRPLARNARVLVDRIRSLGTEAYDAIGWSRHVGITPSELEAQLLELYRRDVLGVTLWKAAWQLSPVAGRTPRWDAIEERSGERRATVQRLSEQAREYARQDRVPRREWLMRYLGAEGSFARGCDVSEPGIVRPWGRVRLSREQLAASLPADRICMTLFQELPGSRYSVSTFARALSGTSGRQYGNALERHPAFGRLFLLGEDGVRAVFRDLEHQGLIELVEMDRPEGGRYDGVRLTDAGRAWR